MSSEYMIRIRLVILFFTLLSLAVAGFSSAKAYFAIILRDRARYDYVNTADGILDNTFQSLQQRIHSATVFTAVSNSAFAIYGAMITVHPRWLREHQSNLIAYAVIQMILAIFLIALGSFVADNVQGFQTSFEKFGANNKIPYYGLFYYGGIAQAVYGSVLVCFGIIVVFLALNHYEVKRIQVTTATGQVPAPDIGEKERAQI